MSKQSLIATSLNSARTCEAKGNRNYAAWNYSTALLAILSEAVCSFPSFEMAKPFFAEQRTLVWLDKFELHNGSLFQEIEAGKIPGSVVGGNYHFLVFAHLASLLERSDLLNKMVVYANRVEIADVSTAFWKSYAIGFSSFLERTPFKMPELRLQGQEKYWFFHLRLMQESANRTDVSGVLTSLDEAFTERNRDSKIKDDNYEIEGTRLHPVVWDFRMESILRMIVRS